MFAFTVRVRYRMDTDMTLQVQSNVTLCENGSLCVLENITDYRMDIQNKVHLKFTAQRAAERQEGLMQALSLVGVQAVVVWPQTEIGSASDMLPKQAPVMAVPVLLWLLRV